MTHSASTPLVIGINGGGTHTSFVLADSSLNIIARAEASASNPNYVGLDAARNALQDGINQLLQHTSLDQVVAINAGMAGIDRPEDRQRMIALFAEMYPGKPFSVENDGVVALVAGVGRKYGVVTISGTGMISLGVDGTDNYARSGGWGHFIDIGSGYAIAREALRTIAWNEDRGITLPLTTRILNHLQSDTVMNTIPWLYAQGRRIDEVAALAEDVVRLANEHDPESVRIITHAARGLAEVTVTVIKRLNFGNEVIPVLMSGGILMHSKLMRDVFMSTLQTEIPNAAPFTSETEAAIGAAIIAFNAINIEVNQPTLTIPPPADRRATEQRNPLTMEAQRHSTLDFLSMVNLEDERVPAVIYTQLPQLTALVDAIAERYSQGGRILMLGAGTSGRLAVLDAAECFPTFSATPDQVIGILAGGDATMQRAAEHIEDDADHGKEVIALRNVTKLDSVIGVAASGSTPFVLGAIAEATTRGALTASVVNVVNAPISAQVQHPIVLATGAEALTGSTRMKAGSAQKMALNMITTGVMLKVGRTYGNLMTDMQSSNIKLRKRAYIIVSDATGLDLPAAEALLEQSKGEIKTAIAAALLKIDPDKAREKLSEVHGNLNKLATGANS